MHTFLHINHRETGIITPLSFKLAGFSTQPNWGSRLGSNTLKSEPSRNLETGKTPLGPHPRVALPWQPVKNNICTGRGTQEHQFYSRPKKCVQKIYTTLCISMPTSCSLYLIQFRGREFWPIANRMWFKFIDPHFNVWPWRIHLGKSLL